MIIKTENRVEYAIKKSVHCSKEKIVNNGIGPFKTCSCFLHVCCVGRPLWFFCGSVYSSSRHMDTWAQSALWSVRTLGWGETTYWQQVRTQLVRMCIPANFWLLGQMSEIRSVDPGRTLGRGVTPFWHRFGLILCEKPRASKISEQPSEKPKTVGTVKRTFHSYDSAHVVHEW